MSYPCEPGKMFHHMYGSVRLCAICGHGPCERDSGRLPKGEDASAAECEASQSGAKQSPNLNRHPDTSMPDIAIQELVERLEQQVPHIGDGRVEFTDEQELFEQAAQALTTLSRHIEEVREALTQSQWLLRQFAAIKPGNGWDQEISEAKDQISAIDDCLSSLPGVSTYGG